MKKAPVAIGVGIIILVLLGVFWWFWSLGGLPPEETPVTRLAIGQGEAFVAKSQTGKEEKAASGMELGAGDTVRTGSGSSASIMVDGRADIRLDENTTVTIEQDNFPWSLGMVVRIKLQSGRIWSRLLKLLDVDQSFEAQANDTVATVRGTALGLEKSEGRTRLLVDHGGLLVKRGNDRYPVVTGKWFEAADGRAATTGDIASSTWRDDAWLANQRESDARFTQAASRIMADRAAANQGLAPDDYLYAVQGWSESLHLRFAGKDAPQLYGRYLGRRLYQIRDLVLRGKSGMAYHLLSENQDEFGRLSQGADGKEYLKWSRIAIGRMLLALADVPAEDASYPIKLKLEEMYVGSWSDDAAQELYARSLGTDARLDEAEAIPCKTSLDVDRIREAMRAADQSLKRVQADADKTQIERARKSVLDDKWEVERLRLTVLDERLKTCLAPAPTSTLPLGGTTSTSATSTTATSTGLTSPAATTTTVVQPTRPSQGATSTTPTKPPTTVQPSSLGLVRIELFAQPSPANVGDKVALYVKGYKSDGSTLDATSKATFSEIGGLGSLNGAVYLPTKSGSATLMATVQDGTQTLRASVSLQVGQTLNVLSALRLTMAGGSTVPVGQSRRLTATAVYSSGYTLDVTSSVKFSADGTAGTVSGSTFYADKQITGQVTVSSSFTENGVTKTADLPVNVVAGSLMQTVK